MNKITVIQLLNKIANGEELPETIKYRSGIYHKFNQCGYFYAKAWEEETLLDNIQVTSDLTEKVEIIEEDKEIETLNYQNNSEGSFWLNGKKYNSEPIKILAHKLIELIEAVNELKKGK